MEILTYAMQFLFFFIAFMMLVYAVILFTNKRANKEEKVLVLTPLEKLVEMNILSEKELWEIKKIYFRKFKEDDEANIEMYRDILEDLKRLGYINEEILQEKLLKLDEYSEK